MTIKCYHNKKYFIILYYKMSNLSIDLLDSSLDILQELNSEILNIESSDSKLIISSLTPLKKVQKINLNILFNKIKVNQWVQLYPISNSDLDNFILQTSDNSIATITSSNVLIPKRSGSIYITGKQLGNKTYFPEISSSTVINIV